jgi:hypothetical protein
MILLMRESLFLPRRRLLINNSEALNLKQEAEAEIIGCFATFEKND